MAQSGAGYIPITPDTFIIGWSVYQDDQYTSSSPLSLTGGVKIT